MSPEQVEVLTMVIEGVARFDSKEAAVKLVDTLVQHIVTAEDDVKDAYKQACHELINYVVETGESAAAAAVEDGGQQHLESGV